MSDAARIVAAIVITALLVAGGCWWWFARRRACDPSPPVGAPSGTCVPNLKKYVYVTHVFPILEAGPRLLQARCKAPPSGTYTMTEFGTLTELFDQWMEDANSAEDFASDTRIQGEEARTLFITQLIYRVVLTFQVTVESWPQGAATVETVAERWASVMREDVGLRGILRLLYRLINGLINGDNPATDQVADELYNMVLVEDSPTEESLRTWLKQVVAKLDWCFFLSPPDEPHPECPITRTFFALMEYATILCPCGESEQQTTD